MCGIAGLHFRTIKKSPFNQNELERFVDALLIGIEPRGDHASGIAAMNTDGELHLEKCDLPASMYVHWRRKLEKRPKSIMLHTRWATQGSPKNLDNNHPIEYGDSVIVHNGHISNDYSLFKDENLSRNAEVDSEIIAALFEKYGLDKAHIPLQKLDGTFAMAALNRNFPTMKILAKGHSSPLVYYNHDGVLIWASTTEAIQEAFKALYNEFPDDKEFKSLGLGEILMIENGKDQLFEFEPFKKPYELKPYHYKSTRKFSDGWYGSGGLWDDYYGDSATKKYKPKKEKKARNTPFRVYEGKSKGVWHVVCEECLAWIELGDSSWDKEEVEYLCPDCAESRARKMDTAKEIIDAVFEDIEVKTVEEQLDEEHWIACELVGEKFSVSKDYVNWVLFDADVEEGRITSSKIVTDYMAFLEEYEALMDDYSSSWSNSEEEDEDEDEFGSFLPVTREMVGL